MSDQPPSGDAPTDTARTSVARTGTGKSAPRATVDAATTPASSGDAPDLREAAQRVIDAHDKTGWPDMAAMEALRAALAASAPPLDVERLGDGPAIGALTPKQVRILDNRHHRVKDGHLCACGSVWAHCAVHRLIVTLDALRAYADGISEASEPPRPEQDATPTGSSSRGRADLDVERLAQVFAVMRAEGGACWPNYTHSGLETIEQRFARAYAEQDATPEGEA